MTMGTLKFNSRPNPYEIQVKEELGAMLLGEERRKAAEEAMSDEEWAALHRHNWTEEYARDFSAARRRKAAKEGAALPDGSFPIYNQEDVTNAATLAGKGKAAKATVLAHIRKRVKALGLKMPPSAAPARA